MAKRKAKVTLEHRVFGVCGIRKAFFTASSGSRYLLCDCADGKSRQLLVDPIAEYWLSPAEEVTAAFNKLSAKALMAEKEKRAAERKRDIYAAKQLATDKRKRALFAADDEVREVEIGTNDEPSDELDYAEANF
jgi:hypothetical protein